MNNTTPNIIGIDLSMTATGVASRAGLTTLTTKPKDGHDLDRCIMIADSLVTIAETQNPDLIVIEELYASRFAKTTLKLAKLHGVVGCMLVRWQTLEVPPSTLKKYATDRGNAGKPEMVEAARLVLGMPDSIDDNQADAAWLRAVGLELAGAPTPGLSDSQRAALDVLS